MVDDSDPRGTALRAPPGEPTADGDLSAYDAQALGTQETLAEETIIPSWGSTTFASLPDPGYQLGALIGHGGMGEVVVAQDQRIGREVAVKRIRSRSPSPDAVSRFLREARIQARLDHPAIVPVYELGTDGDGRPYFTMKRLAGVTLARRIAEDTPVQVLLRAFIDVCLAIDFAHARGVVHRDLKPSNIMLGDYGEVYVLDWGVARVLTDRRRTTQPHEAVDVDEGTTAGAILGTPGYMAPEQVKGHEVDVAADIYALGSILFEILAGEALHPRGEAALASTLSRPQEAPARRVAERRAIPPELDGVCFDALAEDPAARPTARQLADRVQAYLDGDRDVERRRALAADQLEAARAALETEGDDARATAMRRAGRALALDPQSADAAALVSSLILEPPEHLPPDLVANLAAEERAFNRVRSRQAMWAYLTVFVFWIIIPFLHVRSWTGLVTFYGLLVLGAAIAWVSSNRGYPSVPVTLAVTGLIVLSFTRITGPFVITPVVCCAILMQLSSIRQFVERPWMIVGWIAVAVMLPFALEWTGVLHRTYALSQGFLLMRSEVFDLEGHVDEVMLVIANFIFILAAGIIAVALSRRRVAAQRQLQIQAWHLRQLLPGRGRPWKTSPSGQPVVTAPRRLDSDDSAPG